MLCKIQTGVLARSLVYMKESERKLEMEVRLGDIPVYSHDRGICQ